MKCLQCREDNEQGATFCESCGADLAPSSDGAKKSSDPLVECQGAGCHAGPTQIDEHGFCTMCGERRKADPRDQFFVVISAKVAGFSDLGARYKENQDYFAIGQHEGDLALVVCDGVSNSQNSMAGSKAAAQAARDHIVSALKAGMSDANQTIKDAAVAGQRAICKTSFHPPVSQDDLPPAQATFVGTIVTGKGTSRRITVGWVGDSRAYWVASRKTATQISIDDSWINHAIKEGVSKEDALKDKRAHAIVESLGAANDGTDPGVEPDARSLNISESGILLLVSDGFWNYAHKDEDTGKIVKLINELPADADALSIARHLVLWAKKAGGHDNITVVVAIF